MTVSGTNFAASSVVEWNGVSHPTTFINSTQLLADIAASDLVTPGTVSVVVLNSGSGKQSSPASFTITAPVPAPAITSLSPGSATAGGAAFTLTVAGTNFTSNSVVQWDGQNRPTTFVSGTQLQATIAADDLSDPGTIPITVLDQTSKLLSAPANFVIINPASLPVITSISPDAVGPGGAAFTLTVNGDHFTEDSIVEWDGVERTTTFVSSTKLQAQIKASDIATAGTVTITVADGVTGAVSNAVTLRIGAGAPGGQQHTYLPLLKR
jgi:hypothetical protein